MYYGANDKFYHIVDPVHNGVDSNYIRSVTISLISCGVNMSISAILQIIYWHGSTEKLDILQHGYKLISKPKNLLYIFIYDLALFGYVVFLLVCLIFFSLKIIIFLQHCEMLFSFWH